MQGWYHSWVAALRIARRDAWRAKGRSSLVLAMIALPIVGVSAADLTLRSAELSPEQAVAREIGAADARVTPAHLNVPIYQLPDATSYAPVGGYDKLEGSPSSSQDRSDELNTSALPAGTQAVRDAVGHGKIRTRHGLLDTELRELDTQSPLVAGMITVDRGRLPERAGEIVATTAFLENSDLFVGSSVTPRGATTSYKIVGAYELPSELDRVQVIAPPGTMIAPLDQALQTSGARGVRPNVSYLVKVGGDGFTWNMVKAANTKALVVLSRAVRLDPPADADVPLYQQEPKERYQVGAGSTSEVAVAATVVGLAMLEICLLAGPAFAVGARRSRRQLGLVGANGGDRRHIRSIVLSGGLVIGAVSAVIGTVVGVVLTIALRPVLEQQLGNRFGGLDFRPLELAGIAVLAVVTGLLSAIVPAVTASRQTVLASLTGRRGVRRANRVLPVLGLIAVAVGAAIALYGTTSNMGSTVVAGGSAITELGIVALTPVLVGLFGRLGRWMPLSPRLALRDAVRNRGRTAPAVAAVLAAVAGTVAVATYEHSRDVQMRHEYVADLPHGTGQLEARENSAHKEVPALRDALSKNLPVAVRADVDRLVVGMPSCESFSMEPGCGRIEVIKPKEQRCPLHDSPGGSDDFTEAQARELRLDWRCKDGGRSTAEPVVVADEKLLSVLAVTDPGSVSALKEGRAVAFDKRQVKDGKLTLRVVMAKDGVDTFPPLGQDPPGEDKVLPVHLAPESAESWGLDLILPPAAAKAAGLATAASGSYFTLDGTATSQQRQRIAGEIDRMGVEAAVRIEAGYEGNDSLGLLALTVFAGLVTIGAAGIATGLAQADAEADLKTLAAVGAAPRVRRTLSGFQCGVVALMGVVLGTAAGILPAVGLRLVQRRELEALYEHSVEKGYMSLEEAVPYVPISVPWDTLAELLVVVPLGAALLAALVTRSSGALARRAAG
ncbi:ABC transporter permease [Streptomyces virginiae]|uniref:ABC transporter permease n=1 Tax=Streptomyces virginiae TaxID=1961 RepID=UPI002DBBD7E4|nr:ABC transporter permease [Streptomyces sp. CMAA1738]MEC4569826.1 ABC transporter permease [Streptomyces sp. CMAA1738]